MRLIPPFFALLAVITLPACSPTFNWREVRVADTNLVALLPCKPDQGTRPIDMGRAKVDLHMQGCEAGSGSGAAMFTVATFTAPPTDAGETAPPLLGVWRAAALATLHASESKTAVVPINSALTAVKINAIGQRANGKQVESQAVYFAQGQQLFQAAILADHISPEVADAFFAGLKLP